MSIVREVREDVARRIGRVRTAATRMTPVPLLVRGAAFAFAVGALVVAMPAEVLSSLGVAAVLVLLAAIPAVAPRSRGVAAVMLFAVVGWVAATTAYAEPASLPRMLDLAVLLYLLHTTTALAAVLPYDTVVSPVVLVRWLGRTVVVLVLTVGFAFAAAAGVRVVHGQAYLVASIAGTLLVAGLVGLLAALRRR